MKYNNLVFSFMLEGVILFKRVENKFELRCYPLLHWLVLTLNPGPFGLIGPFLHHFSTIKLVSLLWSDENKNRTIISAIYSTTKQ